MTLHLGHPQGIPVTFHLSGLAQPQALSDPQPVTEDAERPPSSQRRRVGPTTTNSKTASTTRRPIPTSPASATRWVSGANNSSSASANSPATASSPRTP